MDTGSVLLAFGLSTVGISFFSLFCSGLCPWALSKMGCGPWCAADPVVILCAPCWGRGPHRRHCRWCLPKALKTDPRLYARKFLVGFPESELIDCKTCQEQRGWSTTAGGSCWSDGPGVSSWAVLCSPQTDPGGGLLALSHQDSRDKAVLVVLPPQEPPSRPAWSAVRASFGCGMKPCRWNSHRCSYGEVEPIQQLWEPG